MVDKHNPRDIVFTHPTMGHWKFWQQDQYTPLNASPPASEWSEGGSPRVHEYEEPTKRTLDPVVAALGFLALGGAVGLLVAFPMPTTIHVFIPGAAALSLWVVITWLRVGYALVRHGKATTPRSFRIGLVLASAVVVLGVWQGVVPPAEAEPPPLPDGKYFIAANLFDNEAILPQWSREMVRLVEHLGPENTFVSIYESNSKDATPGLLKRLARELDTRGAGHRIISDETPRRWAYHTSPGRIEFLAKARNRALEPLQSPDAGVRLPDYTQFTKVVFLNDVVWTWQAAVRLLATSLDGEDYDLACAIDLFYAGMYDMWVARDVCGTPMRIFWPYVKDPVSVARLRDDKVFEVSACWNGMVAFPTEPYLYRPPGLASRGWKMVDNATDPETQWSPALSLPIQFRSSGLDACDHSECFLFSYDLHRLYNSTARPARIVMNPTVLVAYEAKWWWWNNVLLRIPVVRWWRYYWSHGLPLYLLDWLFDLVERHRDYCTWAALAATAPKQCPPLPGVVQRTWSE